MMFFYQFFFLNICTAFHLRASDDNISTISAPSSNHATGGAPSGDPSVLGDDARGSAVNDNHEDGDADGNKGPNGRPTSPPKPWEGDEADAGKTAEVPHPNSPDGGVAIMMPDFGSGGAASSSSAAAGDVQPSPEDDEENPHKNDSGAIVPVRTTSRISQYMPSEAKRVNIMLVTAILAFGAGLWYQGDREASKVGFKHWLENFSLNFVYEHLATIIPLLFVPLFFPKVMQEIFDFDDQEGEMKHCSKVIQTFKEHVPFKKAVAAYLGFTGVSLFPPNCPAWMFFRAILLRAGLGQYLWWEHFPTKFDENFKTHQVRLMGAHGMDINEYAQRCKRFLVNFKAMAAASAKRIAAMVGTNVALIVPMYAQNTGMSNLNEMPMYDIMRVVGLVTLLQFVNGPMWTVMHMCESEAHSKKKQQAARIAVMVTIYALLAAVIVREEFYMLKECFSGEWEKDGKNGTAAEDVQNETAPGRLLSSFYDPLSSFYDRAEFHVVNDAPSTVVIEELDQ